MRILTALAIVASITLGCGSDGDDSTDPPHQGDPWDCQPLCMSANGSVLGADNDVTIRADNEDEAEAMCLSQTQNDPGTCPSAETVVRCSCDPKDAGTG